MNAKLSRADRSDGGLTQLLSDWNHEANQEQEIENGD